GAGLIHGFLKLALGNGIGDQPRPGLHGSQPFLYDQSANRDTGIEIAGEIEIKNGSGVDAATRRFQLVNDFHGANLGRTGDGSRGEAGSESVEDIDIGAKPAAERGDQMHDVGIALYKLEAFDLNGAVFADAAE